MTAKKKIIKSSPKKKGSKRRVKPKAEKGRGISRKAISDSGRTGLLISFEGSEGSGKTTQISRISSRFEEAGFDVIVTREPGGTEIGEEIRHLLTHAAASRKMTPEAELLLFAASRAQLVREVIIPSLKSGKVILCERFLDSTTVYQGVGRQISAEPIHVINTFAAGQILPDITLVLDIPAEVGFERINHRATDMPEHVQEDTIDFYRKIREGYLMLAKALPERFIIVDGTKPRLKMEEKIWYELSQRII